MAVKPGFKERWDAMVKRYLSLVRKDDSMKTLLKRHRKLVKKLRQMDGMIDERRTQLLSEEVEKEFASK